MKARGPVVSWRYHSASLVAVFVALVVGVVTGGLVLHGSVVSDLHRQVRQARADAHAAQVAADKATSDGQQASALVDQLGSALLPGRLSGKGVLLVSSPGVTDALRLPLAQGIAAAGGTVVGDVRLAPATIDPTAQGVLSDVATRLVTPGVTLPADPLQAALTVLAAAVAAPATSSSATAAPLATTTPVLAAFKAAGLTLVGTRSDRPAGLVVVIAPPGQAADPATTLVTDVAGVLAAAHSGVVVTSAGAAGTSLAAVRTDPATAKTVSSLDRADAPGSALRTVLALGAVGRGVFGHYGGPGQTAAAPPT